MPDPIKPKDGFFEVGIDRGAVLRNRFIMPPFSVLSARDGQWTQRKREWYDFGARGAVGSELMDDDYTLEDDMWQADQVRDTEYDHKLERKKKSGKCFAIGDKAEWDRKKAEDELRRSGKHYNVGCQYDGKKKEIRAIQEFSLSGTGTQNREKERNAAGAPGGGSGKTCYIDINKGGNNVLEASMKTEKYKRGAASTPIFDPVLCELMYNWFCPDQGEIFDPFAGGSVSGIVAEALGYKFTGIELRPEQVEANERQAKLTGTHPTWINGDSVKLGSLLPQGKQYDMLYSCPPYYDLVVYSNRPEDGSTLPTYELFMEWYGDIFRKCVKRLKDNRFVVIVVGDFRDDRGCYRNFVYGDNVKCFTDLGLHYYNEIILMTSVGSLPIRVGRQFGKHRKIGRTHQNVMVFYKGNPREIYKHFKQLGDVEWSERDEPESD